MKIFITKNKWVSKTAILIVWLLFWQILFIMVNKEVLIASPIHVFQTFFSLCLEESFNWIFMFCFFWYFICNSLLSQ